MEATFDPRPEPLRPFQRRRRSRFERAGLSPRQERRLDAVLQALVVLFVVGWVYAITDSLEHGAAGLAARVTANPLARDAPPEAAFLLDAAVSRLARAEIEAWRGASGAVRVVLQAPGESVPGLADSLAGGADVVYVPATADSVAADGSVATSAPPRPGIWNVALRMGEVVRQVPDLSVISLIPLTRVRGGRLGEYHIGEWPRGVGGAHAEAYAPPSGLVEVTPENRDLLVSEHFVLGDFLTKGQADVWPKYVVINPRLLDKLELTAQELEAMGHPVENVFVVSGFRTPNYNAHGGDPQGRGALSRHMYGDAADIAIDNDGDGRMDDLNGDGRVDVRDARIIAEAAERVERKYPHLVGGIGVYKPTGAHSGMVHIDTRGWRARW